MPKSAAGNELLTLEMVNQARDVIAYSKANGIKPIVAIVVIEKGDVWEGAFMCLYASESRANTDGKPVMPLMPFFYHHSVATELVRLNVLVEQHVSQKSGIQVHWCSINENFIR